MIALDFLKLMGRLIVLVKGEREWAGMETDCEVTSGEVLRLKTQIRNENSRTVLHGRQPSNFSGSVVRSSIHYFIFKPDNRESVFNIDIFPKSLTIALHSACSRSLTERTGRLVIAHSI